MPKLKRNLMIADRIFPAGTDVSTLHPALRKQIPAGELEADQVETTATESGGAGEDVTGEVGQAPTAVEVMVNVPADVEPKPAKQGKAKQGKAKH